MQTLFLDTPYYAAFDEGVNPSVGTTRVIIKLKDIASDALASDTLNDRTDLPKTRPRANRPAPDGEIDSMEPADEDIKKRWLKQLGQSAAKYVVKSAVEARGQRWTRSCSTAWLGDLPRGYKLYVHKKGHRHAPRKDYYLYGSCHVLRFRSINEFAPHLEWLMKGRPCGRNGKRCCECQYCDADVTSQQEVNQRRNPGVSIAAAASSSAAHAWPRRRDISAGHLGPTGNGAPSHKWMEERQKITVDGQTIYYKDYTKLHRPSL